jgi:hypothetical protein
MTILRRCGCNWEAAVKAYGKKWMEERDKGDDEAPRWWRISRKPSRRNALRAIKRRARSEGKKAAKN